MTVAILAALLETIIGVTLGSIGGYFGGWIDAFIVWLFSTVASVPWILLMISLAYVLQGRTFSIPFTGKSFPLAGVPTIILALGLTSWVGLCRLIRGEILKHRDRDYVIAARAVGLGHVRIVFRHIFPNVFHIVIINFSLGLAGYVQSEVVLSFLGLGVTDKPSWGRMIDDAKLELLKGVWWQMAAATIAIFVFSLAVNLFGDALRDALDPRLRGVD
jgi:ABC-type dipeptide/oligopeptide/nickel transport system permease subunit